MKHAPISPDRGPMIDFVEALARAAVARDIAAARKEAAKERDRADDHLR